MDERRAALQQSMERAATRSADRQAEIDRLTARMTELFARQDYAALPGRELEMDEINARLEAVCSGIQERLDNETAPQEKDTTASIEVILSPRLTYLDGSEPLEVAGRQAYRDGGEGEYGTSGWQEGRTQLFLGRRETRGKHGSTRLRAAQAARSEPERGGGRGAGAGPGHDLPDRSRRACRPPGPDGAPARRGPCRLRSRETPMQMPWYLSALAAAVVWGIHYPLVGYALKRLSLASVLVLTALPIVLMMPFLTRALARDFSVVRAMAPGEATPILALCATSVIATVLLFLSIGGKNATLASLIEISYPVFVALFAWVLFREVHLTPATAAGAALVFSGVALIIWSSR